MSSHKRLVAKGAILPLSLCFVAQDGTAFSSELWPLPFDICHWSSPEPSWFRHHDLESPKLSQINLFLSLSRLCQVFCYSDARLTNIVSMVVPLRVRVAAVWLHSYLEGWEREELGFLQHWNRMGGKRKFETRFHLFMETFVMWVGCWWPSQERISWSLGRRTPSRRKTECEYLWRNLPEGTPFSAKTYMQEILSSLILLSKL